MQKLFTFLLSAFLPLVVPMYGLAQENAPAANATPVQVDLSARVEHLESRVALLEKILFATSTLSVFEAERRLKDAELQLKERRDLFLKGRLADSVWRQDQLQVDILKRELAIAHTAYAQKSNLMEIEVLQAKQNLANAESRLTRSQNLANRGYATLTQVQQDQRLVELQRLQLETAQLKLKAAEEMESLENKTQNEEKSSPAINEKAK